MKKREIPWMKIFIILIVLIIVLIIIAIIGIYFLFNFALNYNFSKGISRVDLISSEDKIDRIEVNVKVWYDKINSKKICSLIVEYPKDYLDFNQSEIPEINNLDFERIYNFKFLKKKLELDSIKNLNESKINIFFNGGTECKFELSGGAKIDISNYNLLLQNNVN